MHRLCAIVALALLLAACQSPPETVVRDLSAAAARGDWNGFTHHLSHRSRALFRAALSAAPEGRSLLAPEGLSDEIDILAVGAQEGVARVEVRGRDGEVWPIVLVEEDGRWRVDLFECQRVWTRLRLQRSLPGSQGG